MVAMFFGIKIVEWQGLGSDLPDDAGVSREKDVQRKGLTKFSHDNNIARF